MTVTGIEDVDSVGTMGPDRYTRQVIAGVFADLTCGEAGAWQDRALCAQVDPEMFFPEKGGSTKEAKLICRRCPVKAECLAEAIDGGVLYGVWGGMSDRERRKLKRRAA